MNKGKYLLLILILIPFISYSDIIQMNNGSVQEGIVKDIDNTPDEVLFINGNGEIRISRSRIKNIEKEEEYISLSKVGDQFFAIKNYNNALTLYKEALELAPDNADIKNKIALTENEIAKLADETKAKNTQQIELLLKESEELSKKKKFEESEKKIKEAFTLEPNEKLKADINKAMADLYYTWAIDKLDHVNQSAATQLLEKVRELEPENMRANKKLLELWEDNPAKTDDVIKAYEIILKNDRQNIKIARKLADLYIKKGNEDSKALELYTNIFIADEGSRNTTGPILKQLFVQECNKASEKKDFQKAKSTYKKYMELFPSVDPTPLDLYEYSDKLFQIPPDDIENRISLAEFAKEKNLDYQAKEIIRDVLMKEPRNPKALGVLNYYAQADMKEAREFFDKSQFYTAKYVYKKIIDDYPQLTELINEAGTFYERADYESKKVQRAKIEMAQELVAAGDNYYNSAITHLNLWRSNDVNKNIRVINDKQEAAKYLNRAIQAWNSALEIDPSLADLGKGDLNNKIADAKQKLNVLYNPVALPMPRFGGSTK